MLFFKVQGSSVADGTMLDNQTISQLYALVRFPDNYSSSFPDNVQYKIYSQE
jgi:hypothetical protein